MSYAVDDKEWKEIEADEKKDRAVLDFVLNHVSESDAENIKIELGESGYCHHFLIVAAPLGDEQDDEFEHGKRYVNQTTDGGFSGDEYAGTVSIPIGGCKWLQFNYSM